VTVFTNTEIARTNAPVAAVNGDQRLKSMGMRLNLAAGTLNLPSRVRSTYVP
jgi:lipopolysaccharide export system protein LptC